MDFCRVGLRGLSSSNPKVNDHFLRLPGFVLFCRTNYWNVPEVQHCMNVRKMIKKTLSPPYPELRLPKTKSVMIVVPTVRPPLRSQNIRQNILKLFFTFYKSRSIYMFVTHFLEEMLSFLRMLKVQT